MSGWSPSLSRSVVQGQGHLGWQNISSPTTTCAICNSRTLHLTYFKLGKLIHVEQLIPIAQKVIGPRSRSLMLVKYIGLPQQLVQSATPERPTSSNLVHLHICTLRVDDDIAPKVNVPRSLRLLFSTCSTYNWSTLHLIAFKLAFWYTSISRGSVLLYKSVAYMWFSQQEGKFSVDTGHLQLSGQRSGSFRPDSI